MNHLQNFSARINKINSKGLGEVIDKKLGSLVEVPFSLPGEEVNFGLDSCGKVSFLSHKKTSSDRVEPICQQFKKCGGCSLQHASQKFVTSWKGTITAGQLEQKGLYAKFRSTFVTPERSRRRAAFSGRRKKRGVIVGFKSSRSENIVSVAGCKTVNEKILAFLPGMERITLFACTRSSTVKIFVSLSENGLDVLVKNGKPLSRESRYEIIEIALAYDLARLSWDEELIFLGKQPIQNIGNTNVLPPIEFFMQASKEGETFMIAEVCEALENEKNVADFFSGFGTFALPLSVTKVVTAFEQSASMLKALDVAARKKIDAKIIKTNVRNLFKNPVSKEELHRMDGAVVNPPRAGAYMQCKELAKSDLKTIVLISCNPWTFARDAKILTEGDYQLNWVRVIDQFRWSHHIEIVAKFSKLS